MSKLRIVHYVNQFFANLGGEEMAHISPEKKVGKIGPGLGLEKEFGAEAEIVATIICGDSYFNENLEAAKKEILELIKAEKPDLFVAGPAFNAGRYGVACGTICKLVQEELGIPAITGMYIENPGADMFKKDLYIVETKNSAADMRSALPLMATLAKKLLNKEKLGTPAEEHYILRGIRRNYFAEKCGAERAVDMLVKKLSNKPFETEYPMPTFDRVEPGKAILDMKKAKIALVTSGGIVPTGNPDRIESSSASKYGEYSIDNMGETAHGGYDPTYANENPNRVLPVDVLKDLEAEGKIGSIFPYYYTTVGNGTSVKSSDAFATEFAAKLVSEGVDGVILTST
jgi:glycine reductase